MSENRFVEWGVRYADGAVEGAASRRVAAVRSQQARKYVEERTPDWEAYEGAEVVCREVVEQVGEWRVP